ncbi:MAG: hypothetical protein M1823_000357 [Watsoniomyces obsoletus]|nr:MAG: hypothetical protein M1823_000357 [Watsoniomyces obsoletus]
MVVISFAIGCLTVNLLLAFGWANPVASSPRTQDALVRSNHLMRRTQGGQGIEGPEGWRRWPIFGEDFLERFKQRGDELPPAVDAQDEYIQCITKWPPPYPSREEYLAAHLHMNKFCVQVAIEEWGEPPARVFTTEGMEQMNQHASQRSAEIREEQRRRANNGGGNGNGRRNPNSDGNGGGNPSRMQLHPDQLPKVARQKFSSVVGSVKNSLGEASPSFKPVAILGGLSSAVSNAARRASTAPRQGIVP